MLNAAVPMWNVQVGWYKCWDKLTVCWVLQVVLKVGMTCQGCVGAVDRSLKKLNGGSPYLMASCHLMDANNCLYVSHLRTCSRQHICVVQVSSLWTSIWSSKRSL